MLDRLKEASSWAGIGVFLSVVFPLVGLSGSAAQAVAQAGAAIAAAIAVIVKEKAAK